MLKFAKGHNSVKYVGSYGTCFVSSFAKISHRVSELQT